MTDEKEVWKPIIHFEDLYKISNKGRVMTLRRGEGYIMSPVKSGTGYQNIRLCGLNGLMRRTLIHRLVAEAFIENPFNYPEVNHKDECKWNNNVDNLEWCTRVYNMRYNDGVAKREAIKAKNRRERLNANR